MREKWGVGSGEWGVGSGEWGVGSGEWGVGSGEWGVGSGEWGVGSGEWGVGSGRLEAWLGHCWPKCTALSLNVIGQVVQHCRSMTLWSALRNIESARKRRFGALFA